MDIANIIFVHSTQVVIVSVLQIKVLAL